MTVKQRQHLLAYLGLYTGAVDGIWGEKSRSALAAFRDRFGADTDLRLRQAVAEDRDTGEDFWQGIRYFTREEFACRCGRCGGFPAEPEKKLVEAADQLREDLGIIDVSSGVRCEGHNAAVGGVENSRHLSGKAMDFRVRGRTAAQVLAAVKKLPVRYAYAIDGYYVHMDTD